VRVFNPFPGGRSRPGRRFLASISDIPRINHRMHNKLFVADNALAITGGRNIGDEYFTRDKRSNFIDLDVVAPAPSCRSCRHRSTRSGTASMPTRSPRWPRRCGVESPPNAGLPGIAATSQLARAGARRRDASADSGCPPRCSRTGPPRSRARASPDEEETIANNIAALMRSAQQEVLMISPYFVPARTASR
jgi:cardiolipin synthase C